MFFCKFAREYKVAIFFHKLQLYVESPNVMVNKCVACFDEDQELKQKWIYFVNRKDWLPTAHSVICIDRFEEKFIKRGEKCQRLCCGKYIQYLPS